MDGLLCSELVNAVDVALTEVLESGVINTATFPFEATVPAALNEVSLSEPLLLAAGELLGVTQPTDVRLCCSAPVVLSGDGAAATEYFQLVPIDPHRLDAVVTTVHTAARPRKVTVVNASGVSSELVCRRGTVLFRRLDTVLRCADSGGLLSQQLTFRTAEAEWVSPDAFLERTGRALSRGLATTALQLSALGFPAPGHPHWTGSSDAFLEACARYPDLDLRAFDPKDAGRSRVAISSNRSHEPAGTIPAPPTADNLGRRWAHPEMLPRTGVVDRVLSAAQIHQFCEDGCLLLDGIWPEALVNAAATAAASVFPPEPYVPYLERDTLRTRRLTQLQPLHNAADRFPFDSPALNELSLHPRVLSVVAELLGRPVDGIRLTQVRQHNSRLKQYPAYINVYIHIYIYTVSQLNAFWRFRRQSRGSMGHPSPAQAHRCTPRRQSLGGPMLTATKRCTRTLATTRFSRQRAPPRSGWLPRRCR